MIITKYQVLIFLVIILANNQEISQKCVCGHVRSKAECQQSGFCTWQNESCLLNYEQTKINLDEKKIDDCKYFAEDECREQYECSFYLGFCVNFVDCNIFNQDHCQQSSYRCVSDGRKCVEKQKCSDYKTEIGCANQNKDGGYCLWVQEMKDKCRDIQKCEELPIYFTNHIMCQQGLDGCTVNDKGYGCINQKDQCIEYQNDFQCFQSRQNKNNCFWDNRNKKCFEKICENIPFTQDYECKSILSECTTNGIHCILRKQCSDIQNKFGCITDIQGNKCVFHQNQCKIKRCDTAPDTFTNYKQCQDYDNFLDCVTSENGGCKQRPNECEGYVGQDDCKSIEQQNCIWFNNKCEKRGCQHAPDHYNKQDCIQYGNCIEKIGGGCQVRPNNCEEILQEQYCEFNFNQERCIWLNDRCTLLECNKLKLPTYQNHQMCQKASSFCTFNIEQFGCADYKCENISEIEYCKIDSIGTVCTINKGCIEKKCKTAPITYNTNQKCEEWLPYCTVNVQVLQNSKILIGCVNKYDKCEDALEQQCYSTFSGINCKWDNINNKCLYQLCTDADPNIYLNNQDCKSYQVLEGNCIIASSGQGCQVWPNNCDKLISEIQCQLNLQDGTKCFWTGSVCKILECSDASIINYTNNIECNSWIDYCIYDSILGGCMNRPTSIDCISSPNDIMYDTHQECQAWNPKCTVASSFQSIGCELKKQNCSDYIRQRNCKTNLNGQNCYWSDSNQQCYLESSDNDCQKRIYGDLTHQDCENFLSKCTVNHIISSCQPLSYYCDYLYEQQCVITMFQQPCKWDIVNGLCKDILCNENITAQTEAECLNFRKFNQCQLTIQSNGSLGPGCESRPYNCEEVTNPIKCKLTLTKWNYRCYFYDNYCRAVLFDRCEFIKDSKSNEFCQFYHPSCILQPSGQGCYTFENCKYLSSKLCNSANTKYNYKCYYQDYCRIDDKCSNRYLSENFCQGKKTSLGQMCYLRSQCSTSCYQGYCGTYCDYTCELQIEKKYLSFNSFASFSEKSQACQDYSSNYKYDTYCNCCQAITSCIQQTGGQQICNNTVVNQQCGYNFSNNICESRICRHLTYTNYSVLTDQICYNWIFNCILDSIGCTNYTDDCTTIKLIQQCYQFSCQWQAGKCVKYIDCQINTTAVTNYECLLFNSSYCRLNYIKGQGCAFYNCGQIYDQTICNQSNLVDGQNCIWINYQCKQKFCPDYTIESDCENSYGFYGKQVTKCFWCIHNTIQCSNNKYCSLSSLSSPQSHQDCQNQNIEYTISFQTDYKCTIKKQNCEFYDYKEACVKTFDGLLCEWMSNLCVNKCQAININPAVDQDCFNWHSNCMLDPLSKCKPLNCSLLLSQGNCNIYSEKCFWNNGSCYAISTCNAYQNDFVCSNTSKNAQGIPCFWNNTQCVEKTCSNNPNTPSSHLDCSNWLPNCYYDIQIHQCIEDCTTADNSYITHDLCESYYHSKICTVKLDVIQCVDLPISCDLAQKSQCYKDRDGNQCYFQVSQNRCIVLTCSNLESDFTSHDQCNQKLQECTVNETLNGCQQLNNCSSYLIQEQCQIDQNNIQCEWIKNQNKCTIKECSTAQLIEYTAYSCRQYYDDQCTVNMNLDGCEIGQSFCRNYNYKQCISDGQINLKGINCFWNQEYSSCQEKICENGPSTITSHTECAIFLSTCQKGGCRIKNCFDYNYSMDSACANIFEDKRCVTNGYQCILRKACEDVNISDGCTFDINLNPCVWIDDKCYTKTCETAQLSITTYKECNSYLKICTVKQDGGCTKKQSCKDYLIQEACQTDSQNFECIWDIHLNQCFSNQCIPFCGDGILTGQEEQCDDGNYLPYDGCYKCTVHCPQGCNICIGKQCQECYQNGWQLVEGICKSKCGDGYVRGNELCDDGNDIPYDGCFQCTYQCHQKCVDCYQGQCIQCEIGYVEDGPLCYNICGDGYFVDILEQCDDGNLQNNDGCNENCLVEINWQCQTEYEISFCFYQILPKIILTRLSKTDTSIQEFKLSFSELVSLNQKGINEEQFLQLIFIEIINAQSNEYEIEIKSIISISTQLADVAYKIIVNFKTNVQNPILKVELQSDNIVNHQGNTLFSKEVKLPFRSPYKISDEQQQLMSKTSIFSKLILYIIISISGISFLFGNLEILWNVLDMLQQLSYMKFHNIQFPENLQMYFEIFTIGSFTPIIDQLQIDQKLQNIFNFQPPIIFAKWKFEFYQINLNFLEYFQTFVIMMIIGFTYLIMSYIIYKILILFKYQNWPTIYQKDFLFKIVKLIFLIQSIARKYYQYFIYSGIIRIYTSNFYELTFASILQIVNFNTSTTTNKITSYLALFVFISNLFVIAQLFYYLSIKNRIAKNLSVLVEGIKNQAKQGAKQYFTILLMKKTLFIINLVVFQGLMGIQSLITACLSGIFSCYCYIYKPFENNFENIKIIIIEVLIMLNALFFSVYEILQFKQDKELAQNLGWINIIGFTLILILTLAIDIYQQVLKYRKIVIDKVRLFLGINQNVSKKSVKLFF
ncbi:unnamed protein product [Paramecium primaurelia]|uniref:Uncharacterized protein n=1 Tax=Paramecium primaurelia TaxID=5886 RepID=A0A8S1PEL4_PARPR|nr:unnamed protein product [Paramecium primaurelia]